MNDQPGVTQNSESRALARSGAISFSGSIVSALMGFVLTVVLARTLGDEGTGVVLQAIAIFTIVLSFARVGMDSAAVWIIPRLVLNEPQRIRGALTLMFGATAICGTVLGMVTIFLAPRFASTESPLSAEVVDAVSVVGWFIPIAALLLVALAVTRGMGGVLPYVAVGSIGLPIVRPIAVGLASVAGLSYAAVTLAWAAPLPVALLAAFLVMRFQVRQHERGLDSRGPFRLEPTLRKRVIRYALPRTLSAGLEQSIIWLDVVIVGVIAGSASAGIYGGASRFIAAGLIIDSALRIVVTPRFSALLFQNRTTELQELYRTAATWLVLFSAPIYLMLAVFASVVLGVLGPEFTAGSTALVILACGAIITFTAGNIHSVLLMSGRSGWAAFNKTVVLGINIIGNLILVPLIGINGAALTWAVSMLVDAILATVEVRIFIGLHVEWRAVAYALFVPAMTFGIPAAIARLTLGENWTALVLASLVGALLFLSWCALDRRRLRLHDLGIIARRR